jgi:hypothetical protein
VPANDRLPVRLVVAHPHLAVAGRHREGAVVRRRQGPDWPALPGGGARVDELGAGGVRGRVAGGHQPGWAQAGWPWTCSESALTRGSGGVLPVVSWIPWARAMRRTCSGVYPAFAPTCDNFSPRATASATASASSSRRRSTVFSARVRAARARCTGSVTSQVSQISVSRSAPLTLMESAGRDLQIGTCMCHTLPDGTPRLDPR